MNPQNELETAVSHNNKAQEDIVNKEAVKNITDLPRFKHLTEKLKSRGDYVLLCEVCDLMRDVLVFAYGELKKI